jgi:2-polyprenyl-6-methoxyphenol hydroxylase-like FAD-dependent oxidoreductase
LTLANSLARYGVPFRLIERRMQASMDSKALALNMLTQAMLDLVGFGRHIGRSANRLQRMNIEYGALRCSPVVLGLVDHDKPWFLVQPQAKTELELTECLTRTGHSIERGAQLLGFTVDAGGVNARLDVEGAQRFEKFDYVVGCDGKQSVVRETLGFELTGADYAMHFELGDFPLTWKRSRLAAHYIVYDDTFFVVVPLYDNVWRVVVKRPGHPSAGAVDLARFTTDVEARLGAGLFGGTPTWISKAPFYLRCAERLRSGRAFIAGDAAHLFSPIGGTGMNTGMQDALNLAWRLAYAWHGLAPEQSILDGYEAERLPVIRQTAAATDVATRLIARIETAPALVEPFLPRLANRKQVRRLLAARHSGLDARPKPAESDNRSEHPDELGRLCRGWPRFHSEHIEQRDDLVPHAHHLCVFAEQGLGLAQLRSLDQLERLLRSHPSLVSLNLLLREPLASVAAEVPSRWRVVHVTRPEDWRRLGARDQHVLVIRPDGLTALSARLARADEEVARYFAGVLGMQNANNLAVAVGRQAGATRTPTA